MLVEIDALVLGRALSGETALVPVFHKRTEFEGVSHSAGDVVPNSIGGRVIGKWLAVGRVKLDEKYLVDERDPAKSDDTPAEPPWGGLGELVLRDRFESDAIDVESGLPYEVLGLFWKMVNATGKRDRRSSITELKALVADVIECGPGSKALQTLQTRHRLNAKQLKTVRDAFRP